MHHDRYCRTTKLQSLCCCFFRLRSITSALLRYSGLHCSRCENLDFVSCTDLTQQWGKEKKAISELYQAEPFAEFCHPKIEKKYNFTATKELSEVNFKLLTHGMLNLLTLCIRNYILSICPGASKSALRTFLSRATGNGSRNMNDRLYGVVFHSKTNQVSAIVAKYSTFIFTCFFFLLFVLF